MAATALLIGLGVAPAASQTPTGTASSIPSSGTGALTLVNQSAWVAPVGAFTLAVDAGVVPADAQIVARIYVPISTQAQLQRVAKGERLGALVESVTLPAAGVARGADGSLQLSYPMVPTVPRAPDGFLLANPGVYPFSVAVVSATGQTIGQLVTELVRLPAGSTTAGGAVATSGAGSTTSNGANSNAAALSVALVVPFGAGAVGHRPDRAATLVPSAVSALDSEADALARYPTVPLAVAPVPETIDTLAEQDRTSGTHVVADIRAAIGRRAVLSGSYVTVDSGAWVAHGLSAGYDEQLQAGAAALAPLGPNVTRTATALDPTATPDSIGRLAAQGTNTAVVLDDHLAPTNGRTVNAGAAPLTQWFDLAESDGSHLSAVPADADLSSLLATGTDPVLAAHQVLAALALVSLDHSGSQACVRRPGQPCRRGVALELPTDPTRALTTLDPLLAALASPTAGGAATPLVQPTSVTTYTGQVDPSSASDRTTTNGTNTLRHLDTRAVAGLGAYPSRFQAVTADIASFRTMSSDPAGRAVDLANAWQQLALTSGSIRLSPSQRLASLSAVDADVGGQVSQVTAQSQQTVTLTSASGKIPFSISNALDYPVRVVLDFESPKLHFVQGNRQTVTIAAGQPAHLTIPVTVRASGAFPMQVSISSPDHGLAIAHTRFDVRSTAISQIGLALTVAAGLFLALWWIRNARSTRRRRSLVDSGHPALRT